MRLSHILLNTVLLCYIRLYCFDISSAKGHWNELSSDITSAPLLLAFTQRFKAFLFSSGAYAATSVYRKGIYPKNYESKMVIGCLYSPESGQANCSHRVPKNIPDIFDCHLKTNKQILIIFGTNIPDTTCHQMTVRFSTSPIVGCCTA